MLQLLRSVFEKIPSQALLAIAEDVRKRGHHKAKQKDGEGEYGWVTEADLLIERYVLDYFAASALCGSYFVRSEEGGAAECKEPQWQLILDPIDGTSPYRRGQTEWGVMIGAADLSGRLIYSWNLLSTGKVYKSGDRCLEKVASEAIDHLHVDVCDYNAGARERFPAEFSRLSGIDLEKISTSELPAAVWVGGQLWDGTLDAMLWLPSDSGKKIYPSHDLIFVGALKEAGFTVRLGHIESNNAFLVVARSSRLAEQLWICGENLIKPQLLDNLIESDPLQLVLPLER